MRGWPFCGSGPRFWPARNKKIHRHPRTLLPRPAHRDSYSACGRVNKPLLPRAARVGAGSACGTSPSYGDLTSQTDPNGNTVCYQYDGIHRLKTVANSSESVSNPCKRLLYDNTANGILGGPPSGVSPLNIGGRLMEVETDDCTWPVTLAHQITAEWFDYSVKGELTDVWESTLHSAGYYHTVTSYF